jgi:hypothetical protein
VEALKAQDKKQNSTSTRSASRKAAKDANRVAERPLDSQTPSGTGPDNVHGLSDTLFDWEDQSGRSSRRTRTARSGNPLITVVNQTGVFDMEMIYCICPNAVDIDVQLFQAGLLPSSFTQIETAFTFSVLDDFLTDNLECKTTAQQYFSKLQSITNRMFPDNVPVCHNHFIV